MDTPCFPVELAHACPVSCVPVHLGARSGSIKVAVGICKKKKRVNRPITIISMAEVVARGFDGVKRTIAGRGCWVWVRWR